MSAALHEPDIDTIRIAGFIPRIALINSTPDMSDRPRSAKIASGTSVDKAASASCPP